MKALTIKLNKKKLKIAGFCAAVLILVVFLTEYCIEKRIFSIVFSAITKTQCEACPVKPEQTPLEDLFESDYDAAKQRAKQKPKKKKETKYQSPAYIPEYFYEIDKKKH